MRVGADLRTTIAAALVFVALTLILTYPQVTGLATSVPFHSDPYFTMWRLGWVAHAIIHSPRTLFDANIFYPERHTLAYSDAMLLPGVALSPFFWAGVRPVVIYNVALLGAFVLSGVSMFALARRLTGNSLAAFVAGMIYAFSPYRFGHYMHLELQLVFWIPLAVLMLHKILSDQPRVRDGLVLGAIVGIQLLSSVYSAIFLVSYGVVLVPCLMIAQHMRSVRHVVVPFVAGGVVALLLAVPYLPAYLNAEASVGSRSLEDVERYSASMSNFVSAPKINRVYGSTAITDPIWSDEMNLFPGVLVVVLTLAGIVCGRGRVRSAYLAALLCSLMMTAGSNGWVYPFLFEYVPVFRGLRSPARFDVFVVLSMAVLSAYGAAWFFEKLGTGRRSHAAVLAIVGILSLEFASAPVIEAAPRPTRADRFLADRPAVVIVELPLMSPRATWGSLDWIYMYQSLAHFQKMLNGYSGFAPASYYEMRASLAPLPDDRSIEYLRDRGVDYVVVRVDWFEGNEGNALVQQLLHRRDLTLEVMWPSGPEPVEAIFRVVK